jgi:hypothetical protein
LRLLGVCVVSCGARALLGGRAWREPEDDTAPKKARGRTGKRCVARLREGRQSFAAKIIVLFFLLQSNGVFFIFGSRFGEKSHKSVAK